MANTVLHLCVLAVAGSHSGADALFSTGEYESYMTGRGPLFGSTALFNPEPDPGVPDPPNVGEHFIAMAVRHYQKGDDDNILGDDDKLLLEFLTLRSPNATAATVADGERSTRSAGGPEGEAMVAALGAAESTVGDLHTALTSFLAEVGSAQNEIDSFKPEGVDTDTLNEFHADVAVATTQLATTSNRARIIYKNAYDLVDVSLGQLNEGLKGYPDVNKANFEMSISICQQVFSATMHDFADKLAGLAHDLDDTAETFAKVQAVANGITQTIQDHIDDKDGWLENKKAAIRTEVYVSCAVSCSIPPACAICYSVGAPIVESQISDLQHNLNEHKKQALNLADRFKQMGTSSGTLKTDTLAQQNDMMEKSEQMNVAATVAKVPISFAFYWKNTVAPKMEALKTTLSGAINA